MVKFPESERRVKFCLKTEIFLKYPARPCYICLIIPNIRLYLDVCVYTRKEFHGHETPSFSPGSVFFMRMIFYLNYSKILDFHLFYLHNHSYLLNLLNFFCLILRLILIFLDFCLQSLF